MEPIKKCPNCDSENVSYVRKGLVAPFFLKRVFGMHLQGVGENKDIHRASSRLSRLLGYLPFGNFRKQLHKILSARSHAQCNLLHCEACSFLCPALSLTDHQLEHLYVDYRTETYNKERSFYEPGYTELAHQIGRNNAEISSRNRNLEKILLEHLDLSRVEDILDYGGGDGTFIPSLLSKKNLFIYEVSNAVPVSETIRKITRADELTEYDYVQICHTLEHVLSPLAVVKSIRTLLRGGGYIYIEVPQDRAPEEIALISDVNSEALFTVHEHINLYTEKSLSALVQAAGFRLLSVYKTTLDFGWVQPTVISALAVKSG